MAQPARIAAAYVERQSLRNTVARFMSLERLVIGGIAMIIGYRVMLVIYNLYFHPLRKFPGPFLYRASNVPFILDLIRGITPYTIRELHEKYGKVVRVRPDELSFTDPQAWKDIMGSRKRASGIKSDMEKYRLFYRGVTDVTTLINASHQEHGPLRKQLSYGFSDAALSAQESIILPYFDKFIHRLKEVSADSAGKPQSIELNQWLNFLFFDVIGDLAFGEPFGCLDRGKYDSWVALNVQTIFNVMYFLAIKYLGLGFIIPFFREKLLKAREIHMQRTREKLERRLAMGSERLDFVERLGKRMDEWGGNMDRLVSMTSGLLTAGTETTSTTLSGTVFLILTHPHVHKRLKEEIRSTFNKAEDIKFSSVHRLEYMIAVISEAMRMYPAVSLGLPREVPDGGCVIAGHFVPQRSAVAIHHYATYRSRDNFSDPDDFKPERWLKETAREGDNLGCFKPFNYGPRDCIGQNLANTEIRTILARLIYEFDLELMPESREWMHRQQAMLAWKKGPLMIQIRPIHPRIESMRSDVN